MEPFKNEFSFERAQEFIGEFKRVSPGLRAEVFLDGLGPELEQLELKQRMHLWADRLESLLPADPVELFGILVAALRKKDKAEQGLSGFQVWPLTEIVARRGLGCYDEAMAALREMTQRFTAEFAVRPFLREKEEQTLALFESWAADPNHHVRRLVSEGSRPFLPWGERLPRIIDNPELTLPLLDRLKSDPSDYVRLSVANHLNDFSKRHPDLVVEVLRAWQAGSSDRHQFDKLARHACRTLFKSGHPGAMELMGFATQDCWDLLELRLNTETVRIGESLQYSVTIRNKTKQAKKLMFDYAVGLRKANGTLSPKVFKGRVRELAAGEVMEIQGRHSFKPVTTRVYYSGIHTFEVRLNGKAFDSVKFDLI